MKKIIILLLCTILMTVFPACSDLMVDEELAVGRSDFAEYTILVYLNGSNLETDHGCASEDLEEIVAADFDRKDINVVIQTGGAKYWWASGIPSKKPARFLAQKGKLSKLEELDSQMMVDPATLTDFIDWGVKNYPAERYGLILWNHGSGAVWGFGYDEFAGDDELVLSELNRAFSDSVMSQQKFEFIGFDACLMANIETAYICRNYASYLIASEELEPGYGWDYDNFLSILGDDPKMPGDEIGQVIVDSFIAYYNENGMEDEATTLSCIDLSKVNEAVAALDDFIAVANMNNYTYQQIAKSRAGTKKFGLDDPIDMVDIVHMAEQFTELCPEQSEALIAAVDELVVYKSEGSYVENAGGISLYFPYSGKDFSPRRMEIYKTSGFSENYINFAIDFTNTLCGSTLALIDVSDIVPDVAGDEWSIVLTAEQMENLSAIYFTAWAHEEDDYYYEIYNDAQVEIDNLGHVLTTYDGLIYTIGGESNDACLYEIERGDGYVRFGAPAELNGQDVNIIIIMDDKDPDGRILGALPVMGEGSLAPKKMLEIKKGDKISLLYYTDLFVDIDEDFPDDYDGGYWMVGEEFTVNDKLLVERWQFIEGNYLYGFVVVDFQGNETYTDFIPFDASVNT